MDPRREAVAHSGVNTALASFLALLTTLPASGCCFLPGDGILVARGEVVAEDGIALEGCRFELRDARRDRLLRSMRIAPKFDEGMTIAPCRHVYEIEISCDGYDRVVFGPLAAKGLTYTSDHPLDLGRIILRKPVAPATSFGPSNYRLNPTVGPVTDLASMTPAWEASIGARKARAGPARG